jgi:PCO_ADO
METISRRDFGKNLLLSLLTYSLLTTAFEKDLFAQTIKPITDKWLKGINELCGDLHTNKITQKQWRKQIVQLHSRIELPDILRFLDFDRFEKQLAGPGDGVQTKIFPLPTLDWLPNEDERGWGMPIFATEKGAAITPHGHSNMVSAHLVLRGSMRVRQFDRVEEHPGHWIVKPTVDRICTAGEATSISETKDNVHWLKNVGTQTAFTLDVVAAGLDSKLDYSYKQTFLDPTGGEKLKDGLIRARKISYDEAVKLYRKS